MTQREQENIYKLQEYYYTRDKFLQLLVECMCVKKKLKFEKSISQF